MFGLFGLNRPLEDEMTEISSNQNGGISLSSPTDTNPVFIDQGVTVDGICALGT